MNAEDRLQECREEAQRIVEEFRDKWGLDGVQLCASVECMGVTQDICAGCGNDHVRSGAVASWLDSLGSDGDDECDESYLPLDDDDFEEFGE